MPHFLREQTLAYLNQLQIPYQIKEHPAVFTLEDMAAYNLNPNGDVCKNLFLRDNKGKRHFLVILQGDKHADLKKIAAQLGTSRLGFASEERLLQYLGVTPGSVSPLSILNDNSHSVTVVIDKDVALLPQVGIHPNDNRATLHISYGDMLRVLQSHGNEITFIEM